MAAWAEFRVPNLNSPVIEDRFNSHKHKMLATLSKDGSPCITGIKATFANGQLWLGMMP